jgi:Fe-S-cluster containining protein
MCLNTIIVVDLCQQREEAIVVMGRQCDGCTACCKTHSVRQILKNAGAWCVYCRTGEGCAIYARRPTDCSGFQCMWLAGKGDEDHRPDKTLIVQEARDMKGHGATLWLWEVESGALKQTFAKKQTKEILRVGICVMHIPLAGNPQMYLTKGESASEQSYIGGAFDRKFARQVEVIPFGS